MTTKVRKEWFGDTLTEEQAWEIANTLAVTPAYFAEVSCEGDRLFGITSACKRQTCKDTCETVLNECARRTLWMYCYAAQQELEAALGWSLTERWVTETIPFRGRTHLQLSRGGVKTANRALSAEKLDTFDVMHYTNTDVVVEAVPGKTFLSITIPQSTITKPETVMLYNQNTAEGYVPYVVAGYPKVSGDNWIIAVSDQDLDADDVVDVLDCLLAVVLVDKTIVDECDGTFALCYTDTFQKVTPYKIEEDDEYYYYYVTFRQLVRDVYQGDEIDLTSFELHKLYDSLDGVCFTEVFAYAKTYRRIPVDNLTMSSDTGACDDGGPCSITETLACITLIDAKRGIVSVEEVEEILDDNDDPVLDSEGFPTYRHLEELPEGELFQVSVSYHTDPLEAGLGYSSAVQHLRQAIAAKVAAEVPLVDCGCNVECGFFKEMRVEMDTLYHTPSGATIVTMRYGKRRGQQIYAATIQSAPRQQRATFV